MCDHDDWGITKDAVIDEFLWGTLLNSKMTWFGTCLRFVKMCGHNELNNEMTELS